MTNILVIDGSYGEGGGQILRSSLSLSAITGRPLRIEKLRANRKKPGLAAQHLTSVRAAAMLCNAELKGAELGSQTLQFIPRKPVQAGDYVLDVAEAREGGSAGAVMLVLQTLLLPLALAKGVSTVILRGGTHVDMSPSYDYVHDVWLPMLARMGVNAELSLVRSGWYPVGRGEIRLRITGAGKLRPLRVEHRGPLQTITGRALAANLPAHISERMASHARDVLQQAGMSCGNRGSRYESGMSRSRPVFDGTLPKQPGRFRRPRQTRQARRASCRGSLCCAVAPLSLGRGFGTTSRRSVNPADRLVP